jgi:hypothetical protein
MVSWLQAAKLATNSDVKLLRLLAFYSNGASLVIYQANEQNRALQEVWGCL